jgi:hypothetical protein
MNYEKLPITHLLGSVLLPYHLYSRSRREKGQATDEKDRFNFDGRDDDRCFSVLRLRLC